MIHDQVVILKQGNGSRLKAIPVALVRNKKIFLIVIFEEIDGINKKYLRNILVLMDNLIFTSNYADTVLFFAEIRLFEKGSKHNTFLGLKDYPTTKKVKVIFPNINLEITKSEADAMYTIFKLAHIGYSPSILLENEFVFTPEELTQTLHINKLLEKQKMLC